MGATTFKIEIEEKSVNVRTAEVRPRLNMSTAFSVLFLLGLGIYVLVNVIPALQDLLRVPRSYDLWSGILIIVTMIVGGEFIWAGFRCMFPSGESLVCEAGTLTIGHIPEYALTGRWQFQAFPSESVKQVAFGAVRLNRYGGIPGLIFSADGHKHKVLAGLEAPEADQVLRALTRLNVNTIHDPGMPMSVEMVLELRKSRLGLL